MLPIAALGTTEILLIVFAILLLFGARKLPELARSLGGSVNEFKKGMSEGVDAKDKSAAPRAGDTPSSNGRSSHDR
jgi:sec-independent protein translocase protein TatA